MNSVLSKDQPVLFLGVAEALVCTATGLFVAIPAVMMFNYFSRRISRFLDDMELSASEFIDLVRGEST